MKKRNLSPKRVSVTRASRLAVSRIKAPGPRLGVNAELCVLNRMDRVGGFGRQTKAEARPIVSPVPETFAGHGDERVSPRRGRGTIHGPMGNSAKKPIDCFAQLFRLCERAPLSLSSPLFLSLSHFLILSFSLANEFRRHGHQGSEIVSVSRNRCRPTPRSISFDQYFNERIIGINGAHSLCRISRLFSLAVDARVIGRSVSSLLV